MNQSVMCGVVQRFLLKNVKLTLSIAESQPHHLAILSHVNLQATNSLFISAWLVPIQSTAPEPIVCLFACLLSMPTQPAL